MKKTISVASEPRQILKTNISDPSTVSLTVDSNQKFYPQHQSPGKAWPGDNEIKIVNNLFPRHPHPCLKVINQRKFKSLLV